MFERLRVSIALCGIVALELFKDFDQVFMHGLILHPQPFIHFPRPPFKHKRTLQSSPNCLSIGVNPSPALNIASDWRICSVYKGLANTSSISLILGRNHHKRLTVFPAYLYRLMVVDGMIDVIFKIGSKLIDRDHSLSFLF